MMIRPHLRVRDVESGAEIDPNRLVPILDCDLVKRLDRVDASIVDKDADRPQLALGVTHQCRGGVRLRDIASERNGLLAAFLDLTYNGFSPRLVLVVGDGDAATCHSQSQGNIATDTARRAGDERHPSIQIIHDYAP